METSVKIEKKTEDQNNPKNIKQEENKIPFLVKARPYLIILPALLLTIGILYPFLTAIYYSLTNFSFRSVDYKFIGLKNWVDMFKSKDFWHACLVTAQYAILTTGTEMVAGLGLALLLVRESKFTKALRIILIFPLMIAPVIATLIWQLMINNSVGIVEKFLNIFGVFDFPWGSSAKTAMLTAGMIDFWVYTPFVMLLMLAGLQSLPKSPYESVKIDGGSPWFRFKTLTLPLLKPFIYIALLFRLMASMQEYGIIFALTKGGPGDTLMNLSLTGYNTGFAFSNLGKAVPYLLVLWVVIYFISKKLIGAWLKGQQNAQGN